MVCDSLSISPMPNNGTLRLPLKPIGLHSDEDAESITTPADPGMSPAEALSSGPKNISIGVDQPEMAPSRPVIEDESSKIKQLWNSVASRLEGLKDWFNEVISAGGGSITVVANKTL